MAKMKLGKSTPSEAQCKATLNSVADALYVIGGKWKLRVIIALTNGNKRFNELQRLVEGISAKVLSAELKELELNEFVRRNVDAGPPVIVEYELTDYAEKLDPILQALSQWGAMHRDKIRKSMKRRNHLKHD